MRRLYLLVAASLLRCCWHPPPRRACCSSVPTTGSPASTDRFRPRSTRPSRATGSWSVPGTTRRPAAAPRAGGATFPAGVLITKARLHLRGMNRNTVIVDGTKPGSAPCSREGVRSELRPVQQEGTDGTERDHGVEGRQRLGAEPDGLQLPRAVPETATATRSGGTAATAATRSAAGASTAPT